MVDGNQPWWFEIIKILRRKFVFKRNVAFSSKLKIIEILTVHFSLGSVYDVDAIVFWLYPFKLRNRQIIQTNA